VQLLFGFLSGSLAATANSVSRDLGVTFELHDSLWRGGDYYVYESGSEKIIIQRNNDGGPPDEPAEEQFPNYPLLMYVDTERAEEMKAQTDKCSARPQLLRFIEN
jgi:hypothetical protein